MNPALARLWRSTQKEKRNIIGTMSGTSLDGLDLVLCSFEQYGYDTKCDCLHYETMPYSEEEKNIIRQVYAQTQISLQALTCIHAWLGDMMAEKIVAFIQKHKIEVSEIDAIAHHGQTIFHAPKHLHPKDIFPNATLQIGEADRIAYKTGIVTVSDFRQKHIAAGGEGAPLVVYGDQLLYASESLHRVLVNIGGIANFTLLSPKKAVQSTVLASDIGAGNCLIDSAVRAFFPDMQWDEGGALAQQGTLQPTWLEQWLKDDFLQLPYPKTTGTEYFNANFWQRVVNKEANPLDVICTLTHFTAECIAKAIVMNAPVGAEVVITGGGARNTFLGGLLQKKLGNAYYWRTAEEIGILSDAKEAILFALLANETLMHQGIALGNMPAFTMGKISLPI